MNQNPITSLNPSQKVAIIFVLFAILCLNVFGETKYNFQVNKSGKGEKSVIFIPGFASSGDVWNETKINFEKEYTCYVLTMPGFAGSTPEANPTFINWETAIAGYLKENKIDKPIIIGHSMGGGLALALAADYPDLIGKIIVVDALPCLGALMNPSYKSKPDNDCSAIINQMTAATNDQFYQMQKNSIAGLSSDTTKHEQIVGWSMKSDRRTFGQMFCDFMNTDLRTKIGSIKCPALILLEEPFKNMKPAIEDQYKNLKTAELQYSDKGLHFIMYDDREWYLAQMNKFITSK